MSYTLEMRESIRKVEATRRRRLEETHPRTLPKEQEEILKRFHPDYVEGVRARVIDKDDKRHKENR